MQSPVRGKWYPSGHWLGLIALAVILGIVIAGFLGVLGLVVVRFPAESRYLTCQFDQNACQASSIRPTLRLPDPKLC